MVTSTDTTALATEKPAISAKVSDDFELIQRAIEGDQRSYATLMERYRNSIFHTMLKMVNNREDADDLTLEAFGKAFNKLPTYAPRYAFSTWLFKIAINNCIDYIRKKKLNLLSIDQPFEPEGVQDYANSIRATVPDPEESVIREQKVALMRDIIGKLSQKYRLMIELRYFEEMSYEEIAAELDIPLGTVKAQLFRAKEIIFDYLQMPGAQAYIDELPRRERVKRGVNDVIGASVWQKY
ncbi:MAG: sigma-70 family RNA polymerase sigma factor [Saprospiraceae bacterium]|nr:sigma-70 family RNA polymerase sigma factor [Saprospiraceae bacterium]MBP7679425.1 sigma-70 family RNA polymerase sigma factor [Saprospiraceae bacterium]